MKKLLLILLCLPMIVFGQDKNLKKSKFNFNKSNNYGSNIKSDVEKLLIEKGNIICDYYYNIPLGKKELLPINIQFFSDTAIAMRSKDDFWEYSINSIEESTNTKFSVLAYGGNISSKKLEYKLVFMTDIVSEERLSNNAKWWFVSERARSGFEAELEGAGLIFHK